MNFKNNEDAPREQVALDKDHVTALLLHIRVIDQKYPPMYVWGWELLLLPVNLCTSKTRRISGISKHKY